MTVLQQSILVPDFLWLEITGKCNEQCLHCYADSSPQGTHGDMTAGDWQALITDFAALLRPNGRQTMVQFIGGEPTLNPALPALINHALGLGVRVEVFSNLTAISERMWDVLSQPGVQLATSYYSADAAEHDTVTGLSRSHARTERSIAIARKRGIPLRVGAISVLQRQNTAGIASRLQELGVMPENVRYDNLRGVGRGIQTEQADIGQLCGQCTKSRAAILPNGDVHMCVFSRWMQPVGNVRRQSLTDILAGQSFADTHGQLETAFAARSEPDPECNPHVCAPDSACDPWNCVPGAACTPTADVRSDSSCIPKECAPDPFCTPLNPCTPQKSDD